MSRTVAVIGAGIAGLTAARELAFRGDAVTVFDKSPRAGGRLATRRVYLPDGQIITFDHGCQFLSSSEPESVFARQLAAWRDAGHIYPWFNAATGVTRYAAVGGMRGLMERYADGLTLRLNTRVGGLFPQNTTWTICTEDGTVFVADAVVCTLPMPQAIELLAGFADLIPPADLRELTAVRYNRNLTVLLAVESSSWDVSCVTGGNAGRDELAWVSDNYAKGLSDVGPAYTFIGADDWSHDMWTEPDEVVARSIFPPTAGGYVSLQIHRWRHAMPRESSIRACYRIPGTQFVLAGDAFLRPDAEGAYLSGLAAAATLNEDR